MAGAASAPGSMALFWLLEALALALLVGLAWDRLHPRVVFPLLAGGAVGLLSRWLATAMSVPRTRFNVTVLSLAGMLAMASAMLLQWRAEAEALSRVSRSDRSPRQAALSALVGQSLPEPATLTDQVPVLQGDGPLPRGDVSVPSIDGPVPSQRLLHLGKPFDWRYGLSTRWPAAPWLGWLGELALAAATIALIAGWPTTVRWRS